MDISKEFGHYLAHLAAGLGHADRHAGLSGYCTGLMLPLSRKSIEPMAARVDPLHASARHQSLHHFVAKARLIGATKNCCGEWRSGWCRLWSSVLAAGGH